MAALHRQAIEVSLIRLVLQMNGISADLPMSVSHSPHEEAPLDIILIGQHGDRRRLAGPETRTI